MSDTFYNRDAWPESDGWQSWLGNPIAGLLPPELQRPVPPATGLLHEVSPGENFLRNMATGAAGLLHGAGILATGLAARGAGVFGHEDALDPAFRGLDRFKDRVDQRWGPHADEHFSGWSKVAGLAGQAVPLVAGAALTGGVGDVAEGAGLGMNALRMAAAAAPVSAASALSQTAGAVHSHDMSTAEAERMLAGKYSEQELMSVVPFSVGGKMAEAAGLSGLRALPVKAVAGAATQMMAGPAARAVGNLGLDETTREYEEPIAPGWRDLVSGAGFGMLHVGRGLDVSARHGDGYIEPPPPTESPPPIQPPDADANQSLRQIAPLLAGRFILGRGEGDSQTLLSADEPVPTADTILPGRRIMAPPLPTVRIEFPAPKVPPEKQPIFVHLLGEQQEELNRLSLTDPASLELNRINYPYIKPQLKEIRRLGRIFLGGQAQGLDAGHKLDAVAGGFINHISGYQDPVQRYIGALWRTRADQIVPGRRHQLVPVFKKDDP